ncbi:MAG: PorV/PorQ family protein [Elusimicrobiota bacterium]
MAVLILAAWPLGADAFTGNPAGSAAQFLRLGVGARALGMGEAYGPIADGADALYWNPAGLARLNAPDAAYSHTEMLSFFHHDHMAYAHPVSFLGGTVGGAATLFYQDSLDLVSNTNQNLGRYSVHSEAYSLAYARSVGSGDPGGVGLGLAMKYVQETIYDRRAGGLAFDGGALFRFQEVEPMTFSFAFRNLGPARRFINQAEDLPAEMDFGASYDLKRGDRRLLVALEAAVPYYGAPFGKLGFEVPLKLGEESRAAFRLGYKTLPATDLGALSGITCGFGLGRGRASFDFAFQPMAELGEVYRFSLGYRFARSEESEPQPRYRERAKEAEEVKPKPVYRERVKEAEKAKPKPIKREKPGRVKPRSISPSGASDGSVETPW